MAKAISIELQGLDQLIRQIDQLPAKLQKQIGAEIGLGVQEMVGLAKEDAPADQSILRNEISFRKIDDLNYEYLSQAAHSPYMEFGTGKLVQVPAGYEDYALEFQGKGTGGTFDEFFLAILNWVHRKGLSGTYSVKTQRRTKASGKTNLEEDYDVAFLIALKILRVGVKPHPFFFKQVERVKPEIIKRIQNVLDNMTL